VCPARSLAVEEHAEGNRLSRSRRQHEMRVASVEPMQDLAKRYRTRCSHSCVQCS
jgi:hypothetical protein